MVPRNLNEKEFEEKRVYIENELIKNRQRAIDTAEEIRNKDKTTE